MRASLILIPVLFAVFMLQSLGRTIYVHEFEFKPAQAEWNEAHARNDSQGMRQAFQKESRAHNRTIDPFWFIEGVGK